MANILVCLNLASYTLCLILAIHTVSKFSNTKLWPPISPHHQVYVSTDTSCTDDREECYPKTVFSLMSGMNSINLDIVPIFFEGLKKDYLMWKCYKCIFQSTWVVNKAAIIYYVNSY